MLTRLIVLSVLLLGLVSFGVAAVWPPAAASERYNPEATYYGPRSPGWHFGVVIYKADPGVYTSLPFDRNYGHSVGIPDGYTAVTIPERDYYAVQEFLKRRGGSILPLIPDLDTPPEQIATRGILDP